MSKLQFILNVPPELNPENKRVRIAGTWDHPLFCLPDLCAVVGIANPSNVAARLLAKDKSTLRWVEGAHVTPAVTFISEGAFYKTLIRSDKPAAEPFTDWVTDEVLPTLRTCGCYPAPATTNEVLPPSPWGRRLLRSLADHRRELRSVFPGGWTVISAAVPEILGIEAALGEHGIKTGDGDLPDGSLGSLWSRHVKEHRLGSPLGQVALLIPVRSYLVPVQVYSNSVMEDFNRFLSNDYLPQGLPAYLRRKPEFREAGSLVLASAADAAWHALAGCAAELPTRTREQLTAAGGIVRAGDPCALPAPKRKALRRQTQGVLF